ncbi:shikimate dehydrogenase [Fulvimarina sp. MAC8]|uniref:shikimate dehydrogenase n=1 Tax=Fulvimarina sp. MAC8 TaxID=3162874 RepID=UPI0032EAE22B
MTVSRPITQDETMLAGLIGRGISLSRTPAMHMAEAQRQGLAGVYRILDMDEPQRADVSLARILDSAEVSGFQGLNITYPFKIAVTEHLDELSDNARAVGAVNTVVFADGRRRGHNTDLWGFSESFRRGLPDANVGHVLLLGAGGAGVAVAHALADCGVKRLSIHDRDLIRAETIASQVESNRPNCRVSVVEDAEALFTNDRPDGVVNATPMGMAKHPGTAIDPKLLSPDQWVADIVYFPLETELMAAARAKGCRAHSGAGMAVFQAVRAFELFTGRQACPDGMKATFDAFDNP